MFNQTFEDSRDDESKVQKSKTNFPQRILTIFMIQILEKALDLIIQLTTKWMIPHKIKKA